MSRRRLRRGISRGCSGGLVGRRLVNVRTWRIFRFVRMVFEEVSDGFIATLPGCGYGAGQAILTSNPVLGSETWRWWKRLEEACFESLFRRT